MNELDQLDLQPNETEELAAERQRLSQRGRLAAGAREIIGLLREAEDVNAEHAVARALSVARQLQDFDASLVPIARLIDESLIALREGVEASSVMKRSSMQIPNRQEWVEQRLADIESLARKHRVEPQDLPKTHEELSRELATLTSIEASLQTIDARLADATKSFASPARN